MSNIGFIGLGKLGLTSALTFASYGNNVVGYDVSDVPSRILSGQLPAPQEEGIEDLLTSSSVEIVSSVEEVVSRSGVVFIAVQTPHDPAYSGAAIVPDDRRDFEYQFLVSAVREVSSAAQRLRQTPLTVAIISTVLPGTFNRLLKPYDNSMVNILYNPFFIAMGTCIRDLTNPEFVLVGVESDSHVMPLVEVYRSLHDKEILTASIESAELIKVSYNTFISMKIVFANVLMEIAHKTGADCDEVIDVLSLASERIISPSYLRGGMGDGGGCHPRDLISMSWLAQRLDLSVDLLGFISRARESQTRWLAQLIDQWVSLTGFDVFLLGKAYKPQSTLTDGSPALLLDSILRDRNYKVNSYDPYVDEYCSFSGKFIYVICTKHDIFNQVIFEPGSVVLDPFGYIPDQSGVVVIRIGRKT
jgi:UDPglucose 6-dehydrogenase